MTLENNNEPKPSKPMDYKGRFSNFLDGNMNYIENLRDQIIYDNKPFPHIKLKLRDMLSFDEFLYSYIKKEPEKAIEIICEVLLDKVKLYREANEFLKKKEKCKFEQINLCLDLEELRNEIPLYDNFSLGTKPYINKLTRIVARFLDLQIFRENIATEITYECLLCGTSFELVQFKLRKGRYNIPRFCTRKSCKAQSYSDFRVKEIKTYREMGSFRIGEIDFSKQNEKNCYTFHNFDYFSAKAQEINLNDVIEIVGIIKLDTSEVGTRTQDQKIEEYIKVIDFEPIELKTSDREIIEGLYKKFEENRDYHHYILDSVHPLSRGIYTYQIFKIVNLLGIISSDSWDTFIKNRCSINSIAGSEPALFKGSIVAEYRDILGANNVGRMSGQDNTPKAFIPTSQRGKDSNFQIRYGAFAYNNKRYLVVDEAEHMIGNKELRQPIKYLEDGFIDRGSDGTILHAEAKLSVTFLMNYANEKQNEGYDYSKSLNENLCNIEESTLQRIDLHYTMKGLPPQIMDVLEKRMLHKDDREISVNVIYNFINEAKRLYPLQVIPEHMESKIINYVKFLRATRGNHRQNIRESRTLIRVLCGISAIRLKTEVDERDLEYLQKHLVNLMVPFFEYDKIRELKLKLLDMNEVFKETITLLMEIHDEIPIHEHISLIRHFLECHYFPRPDSQIKDPAIEKKINEYMPSEVNLSNRKYRGLIENAENKEYIKRFGYVIGKKENKTHFIKESYLQDKILDRIKEIFKENGNQKLEYKGVMQVLDIDLAYEGDLITNVIDFHVKKKNLLKKKDNEIQFIKI